ncbi:hypothetical protein F4054_20750 [Candidatus Poribacteria bacterium]|nr:hypothetical protein [Candidatus Poribacteria bacterium]MYG07079.1 hypothetical protein [Candidatus Poribacteria bacterium]MYK24677.1 hypothetical protein [Candidatus Poribacteria bacterium]
MTNNATLERIYPFFIVDNLAASIDFYNQKLGFETDLLIPEDDPFFGIVSRDNVRILLKHITEFIHPVPNHTRHEWARWDAFIYTPDPDVLFAEYQSRGLEFHEPLADTDDGLRAFELKDHDGYVLCFGRSR